MTHRQLPSALHARARVQTVPPAGGHALPVTLRRVRLAPRPLPEDGADAPEGAGGVDAVAAVVAEGLGGGVETLVDVGVAAGSRPPLPALAPELWGQQRTQSQGQTPRQSKQPPPAPEGGSEVAG